jgi:hypothetical protein
MSKLRVCRRAVLVDAEAGQALLQQDVAVAQVSPCCACWHSGSILLDFKAVNVLQGSAGGRRGGAGSAATGCGCGTGKLLP